MLLVAGVGTVNATKTYASFSAAVGCTWDSGTNTMGFTAVNGWQILLTGFPGGDITAYKQFHATLSGMSDNIGSVRLRIKDKSDHYADVNLVTGENNINLAALSASNPTCDFTNINDITIWSPTSAAAGKVVDGEHPASVTITNAYIESGITGFGNVITSLSGITDGTRFVISDNGTKAKYFYNSGSANENKNANVEDVPADAYCYFTLEKYNDGDIPNTTSPADNIYRIKITNAEDEGYPNGSNGGCYLNAVLSFSDVVISGPEAGWSNVGNEKKDALWYVTYDAEKGFSFQNVYKAENSLKSWLSIGNNLVADQQYVTLYERIDFGVNTTVDMNVNITVDEETRSYQLYVPANVDEDCPLVISLHGAGGHSTDYSPFRKAVADAEGCIVAYPQGKTIHFSVLDTDNTGWDASGEENKDVEFLKAVIEDVASKYQIDRKRIYCCGFSNGGMMTYAMANACSNEIAAFASISGYPINEFHLRHADERPIPFLHIHGKADDFVLYAKMPTIVDEMVARLGANPVPATTSGSGYTKNVYAAADGSFPYIYYEIDGMGHVDFTDKTEDGSSAQTMWNFFEQYTLDTPCDKTLKWAPRIEEDGYAPAEHGWTMNSGTTLLQFGGDYQYTVDNKNVYHSLQFNRGKYKLSFTSTGAAGKKIGVTIEKLTSPNTVVLNTTVNAGEAAELPFSVTDGWGEYRLTMTRPDAGDAITISNIAIKQAKSEIGTKTPVLLLKNGAINTSNFDITPKVPSTLTTDNLYAATFTTKGAAGYYNTFKYEDLDVRDYEKAVIKYSIEEGNGEWRINLPNGSFPALPIGTDQTYEIDLSSVDTYDDFTVFSWNHTGKSITISEVYLFKSDYREVYALGDRITFAEALATSDPFVVVQDGKVLCGPLSPSDGSLTFKDVSEIEDYSWTIAFEEDAANPGSYFMNLKDKNGTSKGYINASVWSHTYLSGVNKETTKGECQDGALWTVTDLGTGKYSIRNLGVAEGSYNNKPGDGDGDRAAKGQGYLAITTGGYWANHVTHYNTSGEWEFYTLAATDLPANDHLYFGWEDLTFTNDAKVIVDEENQLVVDKRDYAPYWAETAKWNLGSFDATEYRYLVFYAKRNLTQYGNEGNDTGGTLFIKDNSGVTFRQDNYIKYNGVNYPDHIGKLWMNRWNEQRATVLDLQWLANNDKFGDGSECEVLDITSIKEIGVAGTFTIGGIFFTNTLPAYSAGDYKRGFDSFDKFGTICLPYSAVCCGAQLYEIADAFSGGISLVEHEGVMEAGKPYLYKTLEAKKQDGGNVDETNVYFFKAGYNKVDSPVENNGLIGTFSEITAPAGADYLILSGNKLYNTEASTVTVGANKAYIDKTKIEDIGAAVKAFVLNFGDDTTGINVVENEQQSMGEAKIFNLAGQRMSKLQRGINIVNGKKVLVK